MTGSVFNIQSSPGFFASHSGAHNPLSTFVFFFLGYHSFGPRKNWNIWRFHVGTANRAHCLGSHRLPRPGMVSLGGFAAIQSARLNLSDVSPGSDPCSKTKA